MSGDHLPSFAAKYQKLVAETGVKEEKAVRRFKAALQQAAPALAAQVEADLICSDPTAVSMQVEVGYAECLAHIQSMEKQVGNPTGNSEVSAAPTIYIERPRIIPGHHGHSMHECSLLPERAQGPPRHDHGKGTLRGMHTAMYALQEYRPEMS